MCYTNANYKMFHITHYTEVTVTMLQTELLVNGSVGDIEICVYAFFEDKPDILLTVTLTTKDGFQSEYIIHVIELVGGLYAIYFSA